MEKLTANQNKTLDFLKKQLEQIQGMSFEQILKEYIESVREEYRNSKHRVWAGKRAITIYNNAKANIIEVYGCKGGTLKALEKRGYIKVHHYSENTHRDEDIIEIL